jgi:putative acetyltransferase
LSRPESGGPEPIALPPPRVVIRRAGPRDARGWIEHVARVAAERRFIRTEEVRWSIREMRRRFRRSWSAARAYLVADADGRLIAALGIEREGNPVLHHVASLGMSVDEGWRGKGIGAALLSEAFRWARWAGVEKLALTVYPHNQRAINLYKRFGFVEEGRLAGHSKKSYGYEDEIVMGRWL